MQLCQLFQIKIVAKNGGKIILIKRSYLNVALADYLQELIWYSGGGARHPGGGAFCAGYGNTDACQGDSGGPLMCKDKDRDILWGLTSHGSDTCDNVGIYTKIIDFMPWIYKTYINERF